MMIGIARPVGNGASGGSDGEAWSQDLGACWRAHGYSMEKPGLHIR